MAIAIRSATLADAEGIARLVSSLGYPTSSSQMGKRMDLILGDEDYATLVACDDEQIVGFIGTRGGLFYESDGQYGQTTVTREQVVSVLETAKDIVRSASNTTLQPTNGAFRFGCSQSGSRAARG